MSIGRSGRYMSVTSRYMTHWVDVGRRNDWLIKYNRFLLPENDYIDMTVESDIVSYELFNSGNIFEVGKVLTREEAIDWLRQQRLKDKLKDVFK